ncbi:MAG: excinuclease ABC subunit UvrA [Planctomycetia bacterium]|nr:excinuclease ABC subunit UvrA [Planctomycetia bacterium]
MTPSAAAAAGALAAEPAVEQVEQEYIRVRGARVHNLQNIDVDIPRDQLTVVTGPSGSGKSSLAFDTVFAEGQRLFVESLSVYVRQFLTQLQRPDVDLIEGLQPTISIDQRAGSQNPRSTVATVTEIHDYLRLLMARIGEPHCPHCNEPIKRQSPEQIVDALAKLPVGSKVILLAPLVRGRKGKHQEELDTIRKAGFVRVRVDGMVCELDQVPELAPRKAHTIEAIVDRLIVRDNLRPRLAESVQLALKHGAGVLTILSAIGTGPAAVQTAPPTANGGANTGNGKNGGHGAAPKAATAPKPAAPAAKKPAPPVVPAAASNQPAPEAPVSDWHEELFSTLQACPSCRMSFEELEPRTFSFNSPYGACQACEGLGSRSGFDPELVAPDRTLALGNGAIAPWSEAAPADVERHRHDLAEFLAVHHVRWNTPLKNMEPAEVQDLLHGDGKKFVGVLALLDDEYAAATPAKREALDPFRTSIPCAVCHGSRLRPEARAVRLAGETIQSISDMPVASSRPFFAGLRFAAEQEPIARPIVGEILKRLAFLEQVGIGYLTLSRAADTLSGGELQRIRLATGIGTGLVGTCYILDEPSIGLHPRDNQRLIDALRALQRLGNTLIVVEHDEAIMRQADHLIDMGPGAGRHGGRIVALGTPAEVAAREDSLTGGYLSGRLSIPVPATRRKTNQKRMLTIEGAGANNLQDVTAKFPLGTLTCVTGVSGSGKSSLVNETLVRAVRRELLGAGPKPGPFRKLLGLQQIDKLIEVDQSPIGRTPRSNPATYTGLFDEIRKVFAATREAKQKGYKVGRFSFNLAGGRCEECEGQGVRKIEMNFLPDLYVPCETCNGARFNRQTLAVRYRDRSIADVLDMPVDEAADFFENFPAIHRMLVSLREVGLGYVTLGQNCTTLSGGEAQRIKLAAELARTATGNTLYVLDEPTTGLHFDDVRRLLDVLGRLVDLGNTVIVIEHNVDVMKSADWIIDIGPEGGAAGGRITATGTPEEIAALDDNATGQYLREALQARGTSA